VAATKIRLHYDGKGHRRAGVVTQTLTALARANGLQTVDEARALIREWERTGKIRRRPDGGYDVLRYVAPKQGKTRQGAQSALDALTTRLTGQ